MKDYQKKFSEILADSGALFFDEGLVVKDGRPTPYFFNAGKFNSGKMNSELGSRYAEMLINTGIIKKIDIIFGPSYKGSAIAVGTVNALWDIDRIDVLFDYDRKEVKTHGESSKKESLLVNKTLFDGCRIFIVDDVWTSGATKYESIEKINTEAKNQGYNAEVIGMGIAVDREQVGPVYDEDIPKNLPNKERVILGARGEDAIGKFIKDTGIPVHSIVGIRDAVNHLYNQGHPLMINGEVQEMDAQTLNEFNQYMETYGVRR